MPKTKLLQAFLCRIWTAVLSKIPWPRESTLVRTVMDISFWWLYIVPEESTGGVSPLCLVFQTQRTMLIEIYLLTRTTFNLTIGYKWVQLIWIILTVLFLGEKPKCRYFSKCTTTKEKYENNFGSWVTGWWMFTVNRPTCIRHSIINNSAKLLT